MQFTDTAAIDNTTPHQLTDDGCPRFFSRRYPSGLTVIQVEGLDPEIVDGEALLLPPALRRRNRPVERVHGLTLFASSLAGASHLSPQLDSIGTQRKLGRVSFEHAQQQQS